MASEIYLALEDGSIYRGYSFGAVKDSFGEVVFTTGMTGYQEVLTDPSYAGQIVVMTYPLIGNYGINDYDNESSDIKVSGMVVRNHCSYPSHGDITSSLEDFLYSQNIPGIYGVDTRSITRKLRSRGVMMGCLSSRAPDNIADMWRSVPRYDELDLVTSVTSTTSYQWDGALTGTIKNNYRILVDDYGLKSNIVRILRDRGCDVIAMPASSTTSEILDWNPDGIVLSPGPGDPSKLDHLVEKVGYLLGKVPIMGICLGHQIAARSLGAKTFKLKFGHRGSNHPVKDLTSGRVYITAQNHGYAVDPKYLPDGLTVTHQNLHDGTIEGLEHNQIPLLTIQYHSEASPGPHDSQYLFDKFLDMVADTK